MSRSCEGLFEAFHARDIFMNKIDSETNPEEARSLLAAALLSFEAARETLATAVARLKAEKDAGADEVIKDLRQMNGALTQAILWEGKLRETELQREGAGGTGGLDLGAARAEIGLRLARLRAAGSSGELSGGAE